MRACSTPDPDRCQALRHRRHTRGTAPIVGAGRRSLVVRWHGWPRCTARTAAPRHAAEPSWSKDECARSALRPARRRNHLRADGSRQRRQTGRRTSECTSRHLLRRGRLHRDGLRVGRLRDHRELRRRVGRKHGHENVGGTWPNTRPSGRMTRGTPPTIGPPNC